MTRFFWKGLATLVPSLVLFLTSPELLGKHPDQNLSKNVWLAKKPRAHQPKLSDFAAPVWKQKLDLRKAREQGHRLVQTVGPETSVVLTLNPELQKRANRLLEQNNVPHAGAVMLDVKTGKVLVMAGYSAWDPDLKPEQLALRSWAPAASVYKIVTAAALLERGVPPNTSVCYHGGSSGLRKHNLVDNPRLDYSCRTLSQAIAKSTNAVLGKLALRYLTKDQMVTMSERFGFNRELPFELPVQPSLAEIPEDPLPRAQVAAGFWHTKISVLHGALIASIVANKGILRWPSIVETVNSSGDQIPVPSVPEPERVISLASANALAKMMTETTTHGTARSGFRTRRGRPYLGNFQVAGKTGSLSKEPLHFSWFVGFAPTKNPEVAFAVLLGNGARWRIKAASAARMLLSGYLQAKATGNFQHIAAQKTTRLEPIALR
ncbi:MAG: penicillin-binding transpeptidase domain-containing protein [Pseudomonadota bacterium]